MYKQTEYVEATSHSQQYTEFKFPRAQFTGSKLISFGLSEYTKAGGGDERQLPASTGALALIDTLTLWLDTEQLCQLKNVNLLSAFLNLCDGGNVNYDMNGMAIRNNLVYSVDEKIVSTPMWDTGSSGFDCVIDLQRLLPFLMGLDIETSQEMRKAVKLGNRRKIKELINSSFAVRGDALDLRLVIEYVQGVNCDVLFVNGNVDDTYVVKRPILVVDKIMGTNNSSNSFSVSYSEYVPESLSISAVAAGTTQEEVTRFYNADGKFLNYVVLMNTPTQTDAGSSSSLMYCSTPMCNEKINMVVNNELFLERNLDTQARKAMYLDYAKGNFLCAPMSNSFNSQATANNMLYGANTTDAHKNLLSNSYVVFDVDKAITQLQIQYERTGFNGNAKQRGKMNLVAFYNVQRSLIYDKGKITISN